MITVRKDRDLNDQSGSSNPPKVALLVMGVGRSGTSALTRVLGLLGAALPQNLLDAGQGNERGHWEPNRIVEMNDEILQVHGSSWYDTRAFPQDWFRTREAAIFIDRAVTIIEDEYKQDPLIVIKDPRICRLAPLYLAALDRAGYSPRAIIPLRHPGEIVSSLARRDGTDPNVAELIWIRHILEAESATRHLPRVWVTFDELLSDWRSVQARIGFHLEIEWPNRPDSVAQAVAEFLEPSLRHFDAHKNDTFGDVGLVTARLVQAALAGVAGDELAVRTGFDAISQVVNELDRLGYGQIEAKTVAAVAESDALRATLAVRNAELQRLRDQSEEAARVAEQNLLSTIPDLAAEANKLDMLRHELSKAVDLFSAQEAELGRLRILLGNREHEITVILGSRSWRLMYPLRQLSSAIRRLLAVRSRQKHPTRSGESAHKIKG
jgi:hypothetical protein